MFFVSTSSLSTFVKVPSGDSDWTFLNEFKHFFWMISQVSLQIGGLESRLS